MAEQMRRMNPGRSGVPPALPRWVRRWAIPGAAVLLFTAGISGCAGCGAPGEVPPTGIGAEPRGGGGSVPLRRLNHTQYDNTVRDLLGDTTRPAREFPADDTSDGFDTIAHVLSMPPVLVEKYDAAAERLAEAAWSADYSAAHLERVQARALPLTSGVPWGAGYWQLNGDGAVDATLAVPSSGKYAFSVRAGGTRIDGEAEPHMVLRVDSVQVAEFWVDAGPEALKEYQVEVELTAGRHIFSVALDNYLWSYTATDPNKQARTLIVDALELSRPERAVPLAQARLRICDPDAEGHLPCARKIIERFVRRAWRRTVRAEEVDRLVALVERAEADGEDFGTGIQDAIHAILLSPHFLFRVELDPDPTSPVPHRVSDAELATRLSYFLWSTTPDDELLDLASAGRLSAPEVLEAQVRRMLADARADAIVDDFAGQWLQFRAVPSLTPDPVLHPEVDLPLMKDMQAQTALFFREFLRSDSSALDLLDADFTFINDRLATHYELPPPGSSGLIRATVNDPRRLGLLTQASFLMLTSASNHTSPVRRGKWVLGNLLCQEPPPPPPNIPPLSASQSVGASKRQRMEQHRASPACSGCHVYMDPVGFALENFDAVGRWRLVDEDGYPVDSTGMLPGSASFEGPAELISLLKKDPALPSCIAQKVMIYGLSRPLQDADHPHLDAISRSFSERGFRLSELFRLVATSELFTHRWPEAP